MSFSYFSPNGDFNNKNELVYKLKNMNCDGTVALEDRLRRYLQRKKYYKIHKMKPCVSPEEEYQITNKDIMLIKAYMKNKRKMKTKKYDIPKLYFPSKHFKEDPRVPKIKKQKYENPPNMGMFAPNEDTVYYEGPITEMGILDKRDFPERESGTGYNIDNTRFDPRTDPVMCQNQFYSRIPRDKGKIELIPKNIGIKKFNKEMSQYNMMPGPLDQPGSLLNMPRPVSTSSDKSKDPDPRNRLIISNLTGPSSGYQKNQISKCGTKYDGIQQLKDYKLIDKCLSDVLYTEKRYGVAPKPSFSEKSDMDVDNKMVIPKMTSRKDKNFSTACYTINPPINTYNNFIDTDMETTLVRGMPQHTTKSYGYRNPEEHFFEFLPEDFSCPQFEDFTRGGVSTRLDNTKSARPKERKIY